MPSSEQPPVYPQEPAHYQDSPFSFVSAQPPNYQSIQENGNGYLAHHDVSVSLPSSSGGLDALLNSPRPIGTSGQSRIAGVFRKDVRQTMADARETVDGGETTCARQASVLVEVPPSASTSETLRQNSTPLQPMALPCSDTYSSSFGQSPRSARVVAERGRREDLRGRFTKLKDLLPMAGQKASKINILDRGACRVNGIKPRVLY